ncbi:hypothetical protein [Deinococcus multiflagellatus]|uniref:Uncharacterized protein n=1 Tax=Deinococcus multiflagellatus TaxID=1656887 RepID=A0ABW1ZIE3_9DEIO|nr:hypothetical protein [Deinococcus multiflagellatus]MBZ9711735.1 hypothetical protein [Deinococcus multiflagellatus]
MKEATRQMLLRADHATEWECPPDFDSHTALREVRAFAQNAAQTLDLNFAVDDQVQDSSFFADLFDVEFALGVRFSAFGRLALAFTVNVRDWTSEALPVEVVHLLQHRGYTVVRPEDVSGTYDGLKKELRGKATWFGRFFDYL